MRRTSRLEASLRNRRESNSNQDSVYRRPRAAKFKSRYGTLPQSLPFPASPRQRRPNEQPRQPDERTYDKINEVITNKTARVFQLSPLYKFKFKRQFLKWLTRKVTFFIQNENIWAEEGVQVPGSRVVDVVPLVGSDDNNFTGIMITVKKVSEYEEEEEELSTDFWGVLCKQTNEVTQESEMPSKDLVNMPVFLVKGYVSVTNLILKFFSQQFDCTVREMKLSPIELTWLAAMWSGYPIDTPRKQLSLKYATPDEIEGIKTMTVILNAEDMFDLWTSVHDENSKSFSSEDKEAFIKSVEAHILKYFRIDLTRLTLIEIDTTSISANHMGRIKLRSSKTSHEIIKYFASLVDRTLF